MAQHQLDTMQYAQVDDHTLSNHVSCGHGSNAHARVVINQSHQSLVSLSLASKCVHLPWNSFALSRFTTSSLLSSLGELSFLSFFLSTIVCTLSLSLSLSLFIFDSVVFVMFIFIELKKYFNRRWVQSPKLRVYIKYWCWSYH